MSPLDFPLGSDTKLAFPIETGLYNQEASVVYLIFISCNVTMLLSYDDPINDFRALHYFCTCSVL
jgi:hypothetical protein